MTHETRKAWYARLRSDTASCDRLISHIMACPDCYGRSGRYCAEGARLRNEAYAPILARQIVAERSIGRRRMLLQSVSCDMRGEVTRLARELWDKAKEDAIDNR